MGGDADRLVQSERDVVRPERNGVALQLVGDAGVVFEVAGGGLHVAK
jgi:hypothetical protein